MGRGKTSSAATSLTAGFQAVGIRTRISADPRPGGVPSAVQLQAAVDEFSAAHDVAFPHPVTQEDLRDEEAAGPLAKALLRVDEGLFARLKEQWGQHTEVLRNTMMTGYFSDEGLFAQAHILLRDHLLSVANRHSPGVGSVEQLMHKARLCLCEGVGNMSAKNLKASGPATLDEELRRMLGGENYAELADSTQKTYGVSPGEYFQDWSEGQWRGLHHDAMRPHDDPSGCSGLEMTLKVRGNLMDGFAKWDSAAARAATQNVR